MQEVKKDVVDSMALICLVDILKSQEYDMQKLMSKVTTYVLKADAGTSVEGANPHYKSAVINRLSELCGIKD